MHNVNIIVDERRLKVTMIISGTNAYKFTSH